jgi:hypothetical protein
MTSHTNYSIWTDIEDSTVSPYQMIQNDNKIQHILSTHQRLADTNVSFFNTFKRLGDITSGKTMKSAFHRLELYDETIEENKTNGVQITLSVPVSTTV